MDNYLLMPNPFKGTMDAMTVCRVIKQSLLERRPQAAVRAVPMADGGEGTVDCLLTALGGERKTCIVSGPDGRSIESFYGVCAADGRAAGEKLAVIEMAAAAGFDSTGKFRDPSSATTYGVGQLMRDAIENGCRHLVLGLGGSCSNDGGAGMAAALGAVFSNRDGRAFLPCGKTLSRIAAIDTSALKKLLDGVRITLMSDIDNPLYGPQGAAMMFAPQKGADAAMTKMLDKQLRIYADILREQLHVEVDRLAGGGAAGGLGAGAYAFLGVKPRQGIDVMLDVVDFEHLAPQFDVILTGEGCLDSQSLGGKAVIGIARRAAPLGIPVIAVVGRMKGDRNRYLRAGIQAIWQTEPRGGYVSQEGEAPDYQKALADTIRRCL